MSLMELRRQSREFFPSWSRKQRARWIRAKLIAPNPKVGSAPDVLSDDRNYRFARSVSR